MKMLRGIRMALFAVAGSALAAAAVLSVGTAPAGATTDSGPCTLLPILCPPTTAPKTTPRATPATTTTPTTGHSTASTTPAGKRPTATSAPSRAPAGGASVGAGSLSAPVVNPADLPALSSGTDAAAPLLAGTPPPGNAQATSPPAAPSALSGIMGPTRPRPGHHSAARIALSILVLAVAAVAAAQLPASRRLPRPSGDLFPRRSGSVG